MRVWIVEGSTGEYSDRTDWPVAAYVDGVLAAEHQRLAQAAADAWEAKCREPDSEVSYYESDATTNPYDPGMKMQYTGVFYSVMEIEVRTALPVTAPAQLNGGRLPRHVGWTPRAPSTRARLTHRDGRYQGGGVDENDDL